jgi:hypothetical protein
MSVPTDFITGLNLSPERAISGVPIPHAAREHSLDAVTPLAQKASASASAKAEAQIEPQLELPARPELEVQPALVRETQTSETVVKTSVETTDGAEVKLTTVSSNRNTSSATSGTGTGTGTGTDKGPSRPSVIVPPVVQDLDGVTGGGGSAAVRFSLRFGEASIRAPQQIADVAIGKDLLTLRNANGKPQPLPRFLSRAANNRTATTLEELARAVFADADGQKAGNQPLRRRAAVLVRATNAEIRGTYLLVNNGNRRLNPSADLMVEITGFSGRLPGLGAIDPAVLFG